MSTITQARMEHPRKNIDYFPHDTPWQQIADVECLQTQCRRRGLLDEGNVSSLQQRLEEYQQAHRHENEARAASWRVFPDERWVPLLANATTITNCQLIQLKDTSDVGSWWLEKQFTLYVRENDGKFTVVISKDLTCSCHTTIEGNQGTMCEHIFYVLEYVLRCPEPLIFQNSFLSVELEYIFAANPYFYYLPNKTPERVPQDDVGPSPACVICFQETSSRPTMDCGKCGHFAHSVCLFIFNEIRKPSRTRLCVLCEDEKEWGLHERESAPQSQNSVDEEDGTNPLHEIKLAAMLYDEDKRRRNT